jgi:hypothetical protein
LSFRPTGSPWGASRARGHLGSREEAVAEASKFESRVGAGEECASKSPSAGGGSGFRQGLKSIFRRGLKRAEKAGRGEDKEDDEGLLIAGSHDYAPLHSLPDLDDQAPGSSEQQNERESRGAGAAERMGEQGERVGAEYRSEPGKGRGHVQRCGVESSWRDGDKGGHAAGETIRVDYKLQRSAAESMSDFISTIRSHRCIASSTRARSSSNVHWPSPLTRPYRHCVCVCVCARARERERERERESKCTDVRA